MVMGLNIWQGCRLLGLICILTVSASGCASFGEEPEDAFENPNDMMPGPGIFSGEDGVINAFGDNSDSRFSRSRRERRSDDYEDAGYNDTTQLPDEADAEGGW